MKRTLLLLCAGGHVACSGQSLKLTADPSAISADGLIVVTLAAEVTFRGGALADGKKVNFKTNDFLLFAELADTVASVQGGRAAGSNEISVGSQGGTATAYLLAPTAAVAGDTITVTASHTTVNKDVLAGEVALLVAPPPLIASGIDPGNITSLKSGFTFGCAQKNIGAFVEGRPPIEVACELTFKNADQKHLPHTPVNFYVEAGDIIEVPASDKKKRSFTYVVPAVLSEFPRDTDPIATADDRQLVANGAGLIENATEQNPSDGLVTLLAVVRGHEAFADDNGNDRWDEGELWQDEAEPFLDVDDDGVFAQGIDDACCDANQNGVVDPPNGQYDSDVLIGRMTHILWSGPIVEGVYRTEITPKGTDIHAGGQVSFSLRAVDRNFNPVAAGDDSDKIAFDLNRSQVEFDPPGNFDLALGDGLGFDLDRSYPSFIFGKQGGRPDMSLDGAQLAGREWSFTVQDDRTAPQMETGPSVKWTVTAEIRHSAGDGSGFDTLETVVSLSACLFNTNEDPCP